MMNTQQRRRRRHGCRWRAGRGQPPEWKRRSAIDAVLGRDPTNQRDFPRRTTDDCAIRRIVDDDDLVRRRQQQPWCTEGEARVMVPPSSDSGDRRRQLVSANRCSPSAQNPG
ncbi:hypothetical protein D9611_009113 [Ephemerocybe angulata]|uniref:Uncharacterized protein n=1 Tax=Ephemerocybe angulata TaxID=980116 RepID=A0A8H5CFB0_9AGAR|nr:hypothetical protein D9611_009113 [Tulosesus angulatus]